MIDTYCTDDSELRTSTPDRTESLLHSPDQAAGGIGLYVNANKSKCMSFKQKYAISKISKPVHIYWQPYFIN